MPLQHTVAIAEDEPDLLDVLEDYFARAGFDVIGAANAAAFREATEGRKIHLAILDITMPGEDGLSLARWLKSRGPVGLIMATALGRPMDRVVGLDIGADDYVVKPYDLRELLARAQSVIRRLGDTLDDTVPSLPRPRVLALGGLTIDPERRAILAPDGSETPLSAAEFAVLSVLAARQGQIVSRHALIDHSGQDGQDPGDRAIDVRIARLRKKLASLDPVAGVMLRTVRGEGYMLDPTPDL